MRNVQSSSVIEEFRNLFVKFGLPKKIATDNGTLFVSQNTEAFFKKNEMKNITSAPYHPATNGQAKRMV